MKERGPTDGGKEGGAVAVRDATIGEVGRMHVQYSWFTYYTHIHIYITPLIQVMSLNKLTVIVGTLQTDHFVEDMSRR